MRILANFTKKVATAQYENETFTVTVEAESEFNNIAEVADYLFLQARSAVDRQINGNATSTTPKTVTPPVTAETHQKNEAPEQKTEEKPANGKGNPLPCTDKQRNMIQKLLRENFKDGVAARRWLEESFGADNTTKFSRKVASRVIEALLDKQRMAA
jgi:hypothetical protein